MVLKRALADRLVLAAAFLVVLFAAMLVSAIPIYVDAVGQSGLRARLAHAPVTEANVQASAPATAGEPYGPLDVRVTSLARETFAPVGGLRIHCSGESEPFAVGARNVVFAFFDGLRDHAQLLAGRWPGAGEVAIPAPAAAALGLAVGDTVDARSRLAGGPRAQVRVAGVYRAERPSSAYWWEEPLATAGDDGGEYGPLVLTRRSFLALGAQSVELRWRLEPDFRSLTIGQSDELRHALAHLSSRLNAGRSSGSQISLDTGLPRILAAASHSLQLARAGVLVPSIQVALLALFGLLFTTALLIERRLVATESLRLRGANAAQIVRMAVAEATLIAVPAVAVAPWLAALGLRVLDYVGPLADIGLRLDPRVNPTAYAFAAGAGVVCVAGLALPALRARGVAIARERRRIALAGFAQRVRLDLVLVVLALLGYWQLRRYHGVLVDSRGGLGIDPFLVAAPAVLLFAGALLSLRLVPLIATLVERITGTTRGIVASLGFRQVARRPRAYARSILLLVLAVAIGVFAATYSETWRQSQVDQALHAAGADLLVEPSERPGAPPTVDLGSAYRALGASAALPAATDSFELADAESGDGELLALDARRAATVVRPRDDFASRPLDERLRPLAENQARLAAAPLPGRPARLALEVGLSIAAGRKIPSAPQYLPSPSLFLYLRDADGLLYLQRLQDVAPGSPRRFVVEFAHRLPNGRLALPRYPLSIVGLELDLAVPYAPSRRATLTLRSVEVGGADDGRWRPVALGRAPWRAYSNGFRLPFEAPGATTVRSGSDAIRMRLATGSFVFNAFSRAPTVAFFLRPGRDALPQVPPVLVSDSFLAATNTRVGQIVPLALSAGTHRMRIAGSFHRFPTLDPSSPAVVADLPTYADLSFAEDGKIVQPAQWLLQAGDSAALARRLRAAPFSSVEVVSRAERERALLDDPVPLGVIGALALGFTAAAAFAAVGFAASATAGARQRTLEFVVLRSLGLRARQLLSWVGLESALVVVLSLAGGTALGLLVSRLVLPYVALGSSGAAPVPPIRLAVPWTTILLLEVALLATLGVIAVLQLRLVQRLRLAPALRSAEGTVAP
ncbi:MAG TPA: FtsX-like permease family protein [Gaiellaceae bacterium]|nr:FtsX-like permease family protein [Gaiellaceae bacterium]